MWLVKVSANPVTVDKSSPPFIAAGLRNELLMPRDHFVVSKLVNHKKGAKKVKKKSKKFLV